MKALLINPTSSLQVAASASGNRAVLPPLGLLTLAALLPSEIDCRLVDTRVRPVSEDDWRWAEVSMITGHEKDKQSLLDLVRESKERGKTVVTGGFYPSARPDRMLETGCDVVVKGEAEEHHSGAVGGVGQN